MTKKQTIVATQKIYDHEIRVVTGCLILTADEDWEYKGENGRILEQGKAGDLIGTDGLLGKYGYEIFNGQGFQLYCGGGYIFGETAFDTVEKALKDAIEMLIILKKYGEKAGREVQQDREFYRPLSGWGEPDDWENEGERQ